jgi:hypothetical protein
MRMRGRVLRGLTRWVYMEGCRRGPRVSGYDAMGECCVLGIHFEVCVGRLLTWRGKLPLLILTMLSPSSRFTKRNLDLYVQHKVHDGLFDARALFMFFYATILVDITFFALAWKAGRAPS